MIKVFDDHLWSSFHEPLLYATYGGKRIRPLILMLSAEPVSVGLCLITINAWEINLDQDVRLQMIWDMFG